MALPSNIHKYHRGGYRYRFVHRGQAYEATGFETVRAAQEAFWEKWAEVAGGRRRTRRGRPDKSEADAEPTLRQAVRDYDQTILVKRTSAEDVRRSLNAFVESFGDVRLSALTGRSLMIWKRDRERQKWCRVHQDRTCGCEHATLVSSGTINRDLAYLSAFYSWAGRQGLVEGDFNPAKAQSVPRARETWRPWVVVSKDKLHEMMLDLPEREQIKVHLLYLLGVRERVVLDLEWERVDLNHRIFTYYSKGKMKTRAFGETAHKLLLKLWEDQQSPNVGWVFKERTDTTLRRWWKKARERHKLNMRLHDLRVTFARHLADAGEDLATIQDLLGHTTITMTRRYIPESIQAQRRALAKLEG